MGNVLIVLVTLSVASILLLIILLLWSTVAGIANPIFSCSATSVTASKLKPMSEKSLFFTIRKQNV